MKNVTEGFDTYNLASGMRIKLIESPRKTLWGKWNWKGLQLDMRYGMEKALGTLFRQYNHERQKNETGRI